MTAAPRITTPTTATPTPASAEPFLRQWAERRTGLPGAGLPWLAHQREVGIERFRQSGLPTPRVEAWKYTNLRAMERIAFQPPAANEAALAFVAPTALPSVLADPGASRRLVFVDGRLHAGLSRTDGLPAGVRLMGLAEALATRPELVEGRLGRIASELVEPLVGLNTALAEDGLVLIVDDGTTVAEPIEVVHLSATADRAVAYHPRSLVAVGKGALVTLVEHHLGIAVGPNAGASFANHVTEVEVAEAATFHHYKVQREGQGAFHVARTLVRIAADAHYDNFALTAGARISRNEIHARLDGTGVMCRLNGAYLIAGNQHADTTTFIDHASPECGSREVYKGAIDGEARAVFQGKILVRRGAQKTDGYQLNNALLLSDGAEIDSKPELEIYADDVKCSHGATVGEIDAAQMFYLRARGIPQDEARAMLIGAFLQEAVEEVQHEGVRDAFHAMLEGWLAARGTTA
jgi:Fe-S cluster assembly protein SufD